MDNNIASNILADAKINNYCIAFGTHPEICLSHEKYWDWRNKQYCEGTTEEMHIKNSPEKVHTCYLPHKEKKKEEEETIIKNNVSREDN